MGPSDMVAGMAIGLCMSGSKRNVNVVQQQLKVDKEYELNKRLFDAASKTLPQCESVEDAAKQTKALWKEVTKRKREPLFLGCKLIVDSNFPRYDNMNKAIECIASILANGSDYVTLNPEDYKLALDLDMIDFTCDL